MQLVKLFLFCVVLPLGKKTRSESKGSTSIIQLSVNGHRPSMYRAVLQTVQTSPIFLLIYVQYIFPSTRYNNLSILLSPSHRLYSKAISSKSPSTPPAANHCNAPRSSQPKLPPNISCGLMR